MNRNEILRSMGDHPWAVKVHYFDEAISTNTLLKSLAQQGAPHGTVIIADHQIAGRGRMGRSFLSPGGAGIYLSALIRPHVPPAELMHLTCSAAVAMCNAIEKTVCLRPCVKWINDLVIGKRKLGGILTELSIDPVTHLVDYAVIGIGINCRQTAADFAPEIRDMATSLMLCAGKTFGRSELAAEMIKALYSMNETLLTGKAALMEQYKNDCITIGRDIQVIRNDTIRFGKAIGINPDGSLIVTYSDGSTECVVSGEVSVRGMYDYV